jgi:hypothetical protein
VGGYRFLEEYSACRVAVSWDVDYVGGVEGLCQNNGAIAPGIKNSLIE